MEIYGISLSFTQIIALIGCFTGCLSLLINIYRLWRERYCLKVQFVESENIFFDSVTERNYSSQNQALIHMILRNNSANPITIHDAYMEVNGFYARFEPFTDSTDIRLLQTKTSFANNLIDPKAYTVFSMEKQFFTPMRLQAYDSFEGYGFIAHFPYDMNLPVNATLIFKTAKRPKHKIRVSLHKFSD